MCVPNNNAYRKALNDIYVNKLRGIKGDPNPSPREVIEGAIEKIADSDLDKPVGNNFLRDGKRDLLEASESGPMSYTPPCKQRTDNALCTLNSTTHNKQNAACLPAIVTHKIDPLPAEVTTDSTFVEPMTM